MNGLESSTRNVLVAQDLLPMMMGAMRFLHRSDIAVRTAASNEDLLRLHIEENGNLIATHPGLPGMSCKTLCDIIRRGDTLKKVSILLLCDKTALQQEAARNCSVNAVVTRPVDTAAFAGKVQQLLDVPPRQEYHVVLNVSAEGLHENRSFLCQLENISTSGILIRTAAKLGVGNTVTCSFRLPDGLPIATSGVVIRQFMKDASANVIHYGISFQQLSASATQAIHAFVDRAASRRSGSSAAK